MVNKNDFEYIEQYLLGTLDDEDKALFEARMKEDPQLAAEVSTHKILMSSFTLYGKRTELKQKLNRFHEELEADTFSAKGRSARYSIQVFWKKYLPTMAVAASVAIITVIGTLLTLDYLHSLENRQISYYKELKGELNSIKNTQRTIANATLSNNSGVIPVTYSATGFLISSNGYIITNRHVIAGADSVYVESKVNELCRYKAKEVYRDKSSDLAILKIVDPDFPTSMKIPYGFKTRESDLGEPVYTLAFPREDMVYGDGTISSKTGFEGDTAAYQISIPVNPGNSGAPLMDDRGNLIGIISGKHTAAESAAFAIKSKHLLNLLDAIPADSLPEPIVLPSKNSLRELKRSEQIKYLQSLVFNVKVYQHK
jgi:S1-C subfamily serine protease